MFQKKLSKEQVKKQKKLARPKAKKAREARKNELALIDQKHKRKSQEKDLMNDKKNKKEIIAKNVM